MLTAPGDTSTVGLYPGTLTNSKLCAPSKVFPNNYGLAVSTLQELSTGYQ